MKLTFAKSDLETALRVPSLTVGADQNEISSQFLFREVDSAIEILSYSGPMFSSSPLICQLESSNHSCFTIPAKRLRLWLSAVEDTSLTFVFDGAKVKATCPRGTVIFQSMDPKDFPYWEEDLEAAKKVAEVPSTPLREAVTYTRLFVSDNEQTPRLCNMQFNEGRLFATNDASGVELSLKGMEKCGMRLRGKNTGTLAKFLSLCDTVSIHEYDEGVIFISDNGVVLGESRPPHEFPKIVLREVFNKPKTYWKFNKEEFLTCIKILTAGADWQEDLKIRLNLRRVEEEIFMSMQSSSGETVELKVPCLEHSKEEGATGLPEKGFPVSSKTLEKMLPNVWENEVTVGLSERSPGGFLCVDETKDGASRLTVLGWILE